MDNDWFLQTERIPDPELNAFVERLRMVAERWAALGIEAGDTQAWVYNKPYTHPWVMLTIDFAQGNKIEATLRLDVDAYGIRGGWSPAALNWDEGVPATEAKVNVDPPEGINHRSEGDLQQLCQPAIEWFERHIANRSKPTP